MNNNEFNFESYESLIEFIQTFLVKNDRASVIVDNDMATDILQYFEEDVFSIEDYTDEDDDIVLISRIENTIVVEYPFNEDGEILEMDSNEIIVIKDCLTDEEIESLEAETLIVIEGADEICDCDNCSGCDELDEEELLDELLEELTGELLDDLNSLSEDECIGCLIKSHLENAYRIGLEDGNKGLASGLRDLLDDIIEE